MHTPTIHPIRLYTQEHFKLQSFKYLQRIENTYDILKTFTTYQNTYDVTFVDEHHGSDDDECQENSPNKRVRNCFDYRRLVSLVF